MIRILHLSDPHYLGNDLMNGKEGVNPSLSETLNNVSSYINRPEYTADAIVVSGDLLDRTGHAEYEEIVNTFETFAAGHNLPLMLTLGNHDNAERANTRIPGFNVMTVAGYRIIGLENIAPELSSNTLNALKSELATPSERGTVLVIHHSPIPSPVTSLIGRGMEEVNGLADAIADSDVRLILSGHYHHVQTGTFRGIPVWTSPSLANHTKTDPAPRTASAYVQNGFSMVTLDVTSDVSFSAMPIWLGNFPVIFTKTL